MNENELNDAYVQKETPKILILSILMSIIVLFASIIYGFTQLLIFICSL